MKNFKIYLLIGVGILLLLNLVYVFVRFREIKSDYDKEIFEMKTEQKYLMNMKKNLGNEDYYDNLTGKDNRDLISDYRTRKSYLETKTDIMKDKIKDLSLIDLYYF